ncbi:MAG: hypothetical protein IJS51_00745, partial [Treponema sp.]|nr:hypothetical protein [Treponema sp.]
MISIQLLKKENVDEALSFIQPYESECVNLASEILRGATDCWALYSVEASQTETRANSGSDSQTKTLAGLFALRKKRSLFFCLPFAKYKSAFDKKVCSEAQRPLMEFFESREPFCINGEAAGAIFLRNILKNKKSPMRPSVTNKYFLLSLDQDSGEENQEASQNKKAVHAQNSGGGLRVIQATAADYER